MKLAHVEKAPPYEGWMPLRINYPVQIPNANGSAETIEVEIDAWKDLDGEIIVQGEVSEKLEALKARLLGLLAPEEIKALRIRLDCTQKEISTLLQIGEKTWTRWETGRERPSRSMNVLLCSLRDGRVDVPYLEYLKTGSKPAVQMQASVIK